MESLYRKYRPVTFDQVVGQKHIVNTLEHAIQEGRTTHAYLFCGPRGTGKTTLARILAKAMVCEAGPGKLPDGGCVQCTEIAEGTHPDVYELDAASRTGVDAVREEIVNRVDYAPTQGRAKVYIIDEVHMLTTQAFNALLKTLEEPPEHVVFILCTTDPQKIPPTILSRVQRFDFRPIASSDIEKHLQYISTQEGFTAEPAALSLVTRHAQGGMRDAISLLEQLSVFGKGDLSLENARVLLGEVESSSLSAVAEALAQNDTPVLFVEVANAVAAGDDVQQFVADLISYLRDVYVVSIAGVAPGVLDVSQETFEALQKTAANFGSSARIADLLELFDQTARAMRFSPQPRLDLEVAFARATKPSLIWEEDAFQSIEKRLASLEAGMTVGSAVRSMSGMSANEAPGDSVKAEKRVQPATATQQPVGQAMQSKTPQAKSAPQETPAPQSVQEPAPPELRMQASTPQPKPQTQAPASQLQQVSSRQEAVASSQVPAIIAWPNVIAAAKTEQPAIHGLIVNSVILDETEKEVKVASKNYSPFFEGKLNSKEEKQYLQEAMKKAGNSKVLTFVAGTAPPNAEPEPLVQKMPASISSSGSEPAKQPEQQQPAQKPELRPPVHRNQEQEQTQTQTPVPEALQKQAQEAVQEPTQKQTQEIAANREQDVLSMIADSFGAAPKILSTDKGGAE